MSDTPHDDEYVEEFADSSYEDSGEVDGDMPTDEWEDDIADEGDGAESGESPAEPPKKKSNVLTILIMVVVAVLGGGFFLLKSGSNPSKSVPKETAKNMEQPSGGSTNNQKVADKTVQPEKDPVTKAEDQGFMSDPNVIQETSGQTNPKEGGSEKDVPQIKQADDHHLAEEAPQPTTLAKAMPPSKDSGSSKLPVDNGFPTVDTILKPQPDTSKTPSESAGGGQVEEKSQVDLPANALPQKSGGESVATSPALPPSTIAPSVPSINEEAIRNSEVFKSLERRVDESDKKVVTLQQQLEGEQHNTAESNATRDEKITEVKALQQKVAELQAKLEGLTKNASIGQGAPGGSLEARKIVADNADDNVQRKQMEKKETLKDRVASHVYEKSEKPVRWVLKGASPGRAILAISGQTEIKTVHVGDTLPQIGRIVSIENGPSGWVVLGSSGKVSQ